MSILDSIHVNYVGYVLKQLWVYRMCVSAIQHVIGHDPMCVLNSGQATKKKTIHCLL